MEFQRKHRIGSRYAKLVLYMTAVLAVCRGIVLAQESASIVGDHVNYLPFTTELADSQPVPSQNLVHAKSNILSRARSLPW